MVVGGMPWTGQLEMVSKKDAAACLRTGRMVAGEELVGRGGSRGGGEGEEGLGKRGTAVDRQTATYPELVVGVGSG